MPRIKRKCPPLVVCDYPTEPNVLVGVAYDGGAKNGSFDENARNVDPTEALVIKNTNYKIKNVAKVGSFDEAARNTDPGEANVADGVGYDIQNVAKTGTLKNLLPKTGQVVSESDYHDGYYHLSIGNPVSPRLIDNANNSINDKATGLQWVKDHAVLGTVGGYDFTAGMSWDNALLAVQALNAANYLGHSDWRLPNLKELMSIVDYGRGGDGVNPAIDPTFFPNTVLDAYWSSTIYAADPDSFAWFVVFSVGYVFSSGRSGDYYVRPVRQY
jgi:hypothetical protein